MVAFLVVTCCIIACLALPVTSNRNVINGPYTAYLPGMIKDVWHVPDFPTTPKDGFYLNALPQPFDGFAFDFPMPYDIQALLERRNSFSLNIMKPFWSGPAETNVIQKGELLYLQASASPGPGQQLYVQSCHASSSPNPADKPEVSLIINKGCVASKDSLVKFVMQRNSTVSFIVRTSTLKSSESYIHCKVYLTDLGLTSVTKFCNYNKLKSRWVDLGGQTSVCDCCGRRCRSSIERVELPVSFDLNSVVSTGPLIIKDEQPAAQTTQLVLSDSTSTSSPDARNLLNKRWIMAGAAFSGSSAQNHMDNVSPWPVQPGFGGGVVIVSQGKGADLSMWLPDIIGLELNPAVQLGIGHPAVQSDEQIRNLIPDESHFQKSQVVDEDKNVDLHDVFGDGLSMWNLKDVSHLFEYDGKPVDPIEVPHLNFESVFDLPLDDQPNISPTPEKLSKSAEGEAVFRQAEMVFKGAKFPEPVLYSKLSLNQAADGSSYLNYEEQKRPSINKPENKTSQLERDGKDEQLKDTTTIKELVSSLLNQLRGLWT